MWKNLFIRCVKTFLPNISLSHTSWWCFSFLLIVLFSQSLLNPNDLWPQESTHLYHSHHRHHNRRSNNKYISSYTLSWSWENLIYFMEVWTLDSSSFVELQSVLFSFKITMAGNILSEVLSVAWVAKEACQTSKKKEWGRMSCISFPIESPTGTSSSLYILSFRFRWFSSSVLLSTLGVKLRQALNTALFVWHAN